MSLLILTCKDDLHADAVIRRLLDTRPDFRVVRINSDNLSTNLAYSFGWNNDGELDTRSLQINDSDVNAEDISVIWYRKPGNTPPHPDLSDRNAKECCVQENREFLRSFAGFFPKAAWLNDYWQMQRYSIKANQVQLAKAVGLSVPETLITNSLSEVKSLAARHDEIIVKPMAYSGFGAETLQYGCFTEILTARDIANLREKDLQYAPAIYQQRIRKEQELRITVVGTEVFACEIQTAPGTIENIDWRIEGVEDLPHRIVELPLEIADRLRIMNDLMGLNFGAFDVIKDDRGTFYFIEVNPNGQYFWIELLTGAPITAAVVSLIEAIHSRALPSFHAVIS